MVPTNSKVFLHSLLNVQEKQSLATVIEIQNNHAFFKDNESTMFVKSKSAPVIKKNDFIFFQILKVCLLSI